MKKILGLLVLSVLVSSCVTHSPDSKVDKHLGLSQDEGSDEAVQAINELRQDRIEEQKRNLERQITDPGT